MSYDHWKTTNPDDEWLGSAPQSDDEQDEAAAAMFGVTLDEYRTSKSIDRHPSWIDEIDDELPF
jgi:hypothetical protein